MLAWQIMWCLMLAVCNLPGMGTVPVDTVTWYEKDTEQHPWHGVSEEILDGIFAEEEMECWAKKR